MKVDGNMLISLSIQTLEPYMASQFWHVDNVDN